MTWVNRRAQDEIRVLWVVEGISSFGVFLAGSVSKSGYRMIEAPRRYTPAALPFMEPELRNPRQGDGIRTALNVLTGARKQMILERTSKINALTALLWIVGFGNRCTDTTE